MGESLEKYMSIRGSKMKIFKANVKAQRAINISEQFL